MSSTGTYAFVGWISSIVFFVGFLMWTFIPSEVLHYLGITYYPDKRWAIILPSYFIVVYILVNIAYAGVNFYRTIDPIQKETVTDSMSSYSSCDFIRIGPQDGIPDFGDMDPSEVCQYFLLPKTT